MRNRSIIALLTIIAILLGANLVVTATGTAWAQDRSRERQPERPEIDPKRQPVRPQTPADRERERPTRPGMERPARCVGITSVGNTVVLAFDDGTVEARAVPNQR